MYTCELTLSHVPWEVLRSTWTTPSPASRWTVADNSSSRGNWSLSFHQTALCPLPAHSLWPVRPTTVPLPQNNQGRPDSNYESLRARCDSHPVSLYWLFRNMRFSEVCFLERISAWENELKCSCLSERDQLSTAILPKVNPLAGSAGTLNRYCMP